MGTHAPAPGPAGAAGRHALRTGHRRRGRVRTLIPGPILALLYPVTAFDLGNSAHAPVSYYLIGALFWLAILAAATVIDARAERQAHSRPGPRPRRVYLALAGAWLLPVAGMAVLLTASGGRQPSWWPGTDAGQALAGLGTYLVAMSSLTALVLLGRAVTSGRFRRMFWRYPPGGLAD